MKDCAYSLITMGSWSEQKESSRHGELRQRGCLWKGRSWCDLASIAISWSRNYQCNNERWGEPRVGHKEQHHKPKHPKLTTRDTWRSGFYIARKKTSWQINYNKFKYQEPMWMLNFLRCCRVMWQPCCPLCMTLDCWIKKINFEGS